jgi:hypothetical protein
MMAVQNEPIMTERRAILLALLAAPVAAQAAEGTQTLYMNGTDAFRGKTLQQTVQELVDREEIRELIARYAHRVAHAISLADLFTDDGVYIVRFPDRPVQETRGRQALDAHFGKPGAFDAQPLPMIHNLLLDIDGNEAKGICSNELRMAENGKSMIGSGYYQDQFRRENGHWKFAVRDMTFIHWVPIQEGWVRPVPKS